MAQFKSLATLVALALAAVLAPAADAHALAVHGSEHAARSVDHMELVRRQNRAKKRCPNRAGTTPLKANVTTTDKPKETTTEPPKETSKPAPKPSTTQKPAPKPTSTPKPVPIPAGSGKMGLIFTGNMPGTFRKASNALNKKIWATYNWTPNKLDEVADSGVPFIPMFWGYKSAGDWDKVKRGYAKMALGCNEVNQPGQSQMSVGEGIDIWKKYLSPLTSQGYALFSHSISNAPSGLNWLEDFRDQCKTCWDETAAVAVHYYSNNADGMIDYLQDAHNRLGKKLIVTEFGCVDFSGGNDQCNVDQVKAFIEKTTDFMNKQSWIVSYFYFGSFTPDSPTGGVPGSSALFNDDGSFTSVGKTYVSA